MEITLLNPVIYPLSNPQKRIWYVEKTHPDTAVFCLGGIVRFKGSIDFSILEQAINECVRQNNAMRIQIPENTIGQYIVPFASFNIEYFDFSNSENGKHAFDVWASDRFCRPFNFSDAPLYYFAFYKLNNNEVGYLIKAHHIIMDGWSVSLLTSQIYNHYYRIKGNATQGIEPRPDYLPYLEAEDAYAQSGLALKDREFWLSKFSPVHEGSLINISGIGAGKRITFLLDTVQVAKLRKYLSDNKVSLNVYYSALMLFYLYKTTNANEITIGIPIANRLTKTDKQTIGMFTSTMPFRFRLSPDQTFPAFLLSVSRELRSFYAYQRYPYNVLVNDLGLSKMGYNNLFNVCVNYYNTKHATSLDNILVENEELYSGYQYYPLQIIVKEWLDEDNIQLQFDYRNDAYTQDKVCMIKECFDSITEQVLQNDERKLCAVSLLDGKTTDLLLNCYNDEQPSPDLNGKTVLSLFNEQVRRNPDRIAISDKNSYLTYAELDRRINQLATYLRMHNIGSGSTVCVVSDRNINYVIIVWAVLRSGACFVPVDPLLAPERRKHIVRQTSPAAIISNTGTNVTEEGYHTIDINDIKGLDAIEVYDQLPVVNPGDVAYIMYTSGSTGTPKGIVVEHASLANYISWAASIYLDAETDVFAFYSSIGFDLTITSLFAPLVKGAQVRVFPETVSGNIIRDMIAERKVTVIKLTPSHLALIKDLDNSNAIVKVLIVGGESFSTTLAQQVHNSFNNRITIYNEYGPTETTVGCMIYQYTPADNALSSVPIGKPIANTQIYILNADLQPLPMWHSGEIYIAGANVARGYFMNEQISRQAFLPNPYKPGEKMYKTGDYAMFIDAGRILYEGRKDTQVKIRGYRIELQEIENVLARHEAVKEAVVLLIPGGTAEKHLAAYIVLAKPATENEMRNFLKEYVPEYMVPLFFFFLEKIPLNINGKVAKEQLQHIVDAAATADIIHTEYTATAFEREIMQLLQTVLSVQSIGLEDNFYFIGGDSIKAIQFSSKLAERGLRINVQEILMDPVIKKIIRKIAIKQGPTADNTQRTGYIETTPAVAWFLNQEFAEPGYYTQSVLLELKVPVDVTILENIFTRLIHHHDALRISYNREAKQLFYNNVFSNEHFPVEEHDLSAIAPLLQKQKIKEIGVAVKSSFAIDTACLIKICLLTLDKERQMLLIAAHHLVIDGVSMRILLEDLLALLSGHINGRLQELPVKSDSFQQWALQFKKDYYHLPEIKEIEYWKKINDISMVNLRNYVCSNSGQHKGNQTIKDLVNSDETTYLLSAANKIYNTSAGELLLIATALVVSGIAKSNTVVLELEGHGRNIAFSTEMNVYRTIGWFTQFVIRPFIIPTGNLNEQIKSIKDQLRDPEFETPRYTVLRDVLKMLNPQPDFIRFNYLGDFDNVASNGVFNISDDETGPDISPANKLNCLFELNCYVLNGCLQIHITYAAGQTAERVIKDFILEFKRQLTEILTFIRSKNTKELSPSDFSMVSISQSELDSLFN